MDSELVRIIESLIFVSRQPVTTRALARAAHMRSAEVEEAVREIREAYAPRGMALEEVAGGWQFRTIPEAAEAIKRLLKSKPVRLTRASLEVLAIVAYRQPCTRAEVDHIRGVDSSGVVKFLMERGFVKIIGKKEEPGRPFLYATTAHFLEFFSLSKLQDLPPLREAIDLGADEMPPEVIEAAAPAEPSLEDALSDYVGDDEPPDEESS